MAQKIEILLDTNFLMLPAQHKIDIFSELERILDFSFELFIIDKSICELDKIISDAKVKDKIAANVAKQLVKSKGIKIIKTSGEKADDILVDISKGGEFIVATADNELKRRLKRNNIKVITLRKRKYLIMS